MIKSTNWGLSPLILLLSIIVISSGHTDIPLAEVWWREQERQPSMSYQLVTKKRLVSEPRWLYYVRMLSQSRDRRLLVIWVSYQLAVYLLGALYRLIEQLWIYVPVPPDGVYGVSWQRELSASDYVQQVELKILFEVSPVVVSEWVEEVTDSRALLSAKELVSSSPAIVESKPSVSSTERVLQLEGSVEAEANCSELSAVMPLPTVRPRRCQTEQSHSVSNRGQQQIRLPIEQEKHQTIVLDKVPFRQWLDGLIAQYPELFPTTIDQGYILDGFLPASKKMPDVRLRRIKLKVKDKTGCGVYTIVPSYVLPYMRGTVDEVEFPLFLRRFGVPYWALTKLFGRNNMYWYQLECCFGNFSLVGTTLKQPDQLPEHVLADEKHTHFNGQKAYIAMTGAYDCLFSIGASLAADTQALTLAYQAFQTETQLINPTYFPKTVNLDGWAATQNAWYSLFPNTTPVNCFLHAFIKIRSRCKSKPYFNQLSSLVWNAYHAPDKETFSTRIDELQQWATLNIPQEQALETVQKLCNRKKDWLNLYDFPNAFRTSTWLDQQMKALDRYLFSTNYFNGHLASMDKRLRAWAILHNFRPFCPTANSAPDFVSPAHKLNQKLYHHNWLHNLLVSASMNGFREQPKKNLA